MQNFLEKIINKNSFNETDKALIQKAYNVAELAHRGQKRLSGEDYISHPLHAAYFLSELGMDSTTIAACLLHDTLEDTNLKPDDIKRDFGQEILFLVEGVTKLGKIEYSPDSPNRKTALENIGSLKKMFFAMAEDIRVILIKLADRYHNMETLRNQPKPAQKRIALETLEIYAPIAGRLGMGRLKGQLEDMAFPYVYPEDYAWLIKHVKEKYTDRMEYIDRTKPIIKRHLTDAGISVVDLHSRAKHHYSLYGKIKRHSMDAEKVFDLVAMRIIVPDIKSCYEALGIIHKYYKPLPGLIKDYIALPKPNGYQSLHTTIFCEKGRIVEIQIRTPDMHKHAENGIAAHWAYSEGGKRQLKANIKEAEWVNQLKQFVQEMKPHEGLTNLKIDFFKNRIFAFTPKGDVKDLPEGSTPIDFAYAIHTDLGHSLKGAKINGKIVSLNHTLKNGDVIEIIKGKVLKPSSDWLRIAKTSDAKKKIKAWFAVEEKKNKEQEIENNEQTISRRNQSKKKISVVIAKSGVPVIQNQTGLMYKIARCCKPKVGDNIKGYMTVNQGVSIHLVSCSNLKKATGKRLLSASWSVKSK
jgi:GTP pyrophosphokinase